MQHSVCKFLLPLLLLLACNQPQTTDYQLSVRVLKSSLRAEPSEKSREIATLTKDQQLLDLEETSTFESQISEGGARYQTPWLKVQTTDNQTGWVLAYAVKPIKAQKDWLLQKRLDCYFGRNLRHKRNLLVEQFEQIETDAQLASVWDNAVTLRDTFLELLSSRPEPGFQPQFGWLADVLPAFVSQKNKDFAWPFLFADYRVFHEKALKTNGLQDDAFFSLCIAAYPLDSIESFFPFWTFQLSESTAASQLGTGQHSEMLRKIDAALEAGPLFAKSLSRMKEQVLEDIFGKNQQYWQPKEKIVAELGELLQNSPQCLSIQDRTALEIRQKMFQEPEANGLKVNLRSGE
jgi:hypothetical protein